MMRPDFAFFTGVVAGRNTRILSPPFNGKTLLHFLQAIAPYKVEHFFNVFLF